MKSNLVRIVLFVAIGMVAGPRKFGYAQVPAAPWLDQSKPVSWNKPGLSIPAAPAVQELVNPYCRELARPPELAEDIRVRDRGWQLYGPYQGGWQIVVIHGTATHDGMCRPWQYQAFVFVRGVFAGTLSPKPMDSRTDGALTRVFLVNDHQLRAEYVRYAAKDPACCPSRTTSVEFEIARDEPVVRPLSASTSSNR